MAQPAPVSQARDQALAAAVQAVAPSVVRVKRGLTGPDSLRRALGSRPGQAVNVSVVRGGRRVTLDVTLGGKS